MPAPSTSELGRALDQRPSAFDLVGAALVVAGVAIQERDSLDAEEVTVASAQ